MGSTKGENIFTRKIVSILILLILYIFTGIFAEDRILNPFHPFTYFDDIELMIATASSIMFGGVIGATVGGIGYFMLEIVLRIVGDKTDPLGVAELIRALGYVIGNFIVGWLAKSKDQAPSSFRRMFFNPKTWYFLIMNTFTAIFGIAIVTNAIIGLLSPNIDLTAFFTIFLSRFYFSVQLIITMLPIILFLYYSVQVIREKRIKILDKLYHDLDTKIETDGPAEILDIGFQDYALQIGRWTPIDVTFKHTWKAPRSYEIETVSTSKVYPHKDTTSVLQEHEKWTHTIYVLPLEQDHVDIRIRIHPAHTVKYKENPQQQTLASITGKTYIQRDLLLIGVVVLSEVIITLFLFSMLWNQIATFFVQEVIGSDVASSNLPSYTVPWNLIIVIALIEAALFIPFLTIMYRIQRPKVPDHYEEVLAFSNDIQTHSYDGRGTKSSIFEFKNQYFVIPFLILIFTIFSVYLTLKLFNISQDVVATGVIEVEHLYLILLTFGTFLSWSITILLLNNSSSLFSIGEKISIQSGRYITEVKTLNQLKIYKPAEIIFKVKNVTSSPGLRIAFESNDAISPPVIELHIDPGETAYFKTSVTPQATGQQEILAIIYPLFDEEKNYIEMKASQPMVSQNISYHVIGQTIIGITESQARTLRHIFGWGSLLTSTIALANEYVGIEEAIRQWQETMPFLATIQIPFLYLYYLFSNKFLTDIKLSH